MSYAIGWKSGAWQAFRKLDLELQEIVLDEVERFANAADLLPNRSLPLTLDHEIRQRVGAILYDLFVRLEYDPPRRALVVVRFGFCARPKPG